MKPYYTDAMLKITFALLLALVSLMAAAQDYAREARWKSEVLGNLVVGDAVEVKLPGGRAFLGLYTAGEPAKPAVLIVHGIGVHPDHGVIGMLRGALADMGFSTLSIQMPVLAADAQSEDYHPELFPEASARIAAGHAWLGAKGHRVVVLASHSLGSWMSQYHLESAKISSAQSGKPARLAGWVSMGRSGTLGDPAKIGVPVLDVYGEKDLPAVLSSAAARREALQRLPGSRQRVIAGADHFYAGQEEKLAAAIREFIDALPPLGS
jgi:pimeloyl-ACP methyl ester carboxylesterase